MADYLGYHWYFTHLTGLAMRDPTLALASGNNDLYTAPAGKRALVRSGVAYNSSGGAISFYHLLKSGGNYYQLSAPFSLAAATQTSWAGNAVAQGVGIVLEPGESIATNATGAGITIWYSIMEYDNTCLLYSPRVLALANGNNAVYTCGSARTAYLYGATTAGVGARSAYYFNASGGARTVSGAYVPSGGAAATLAWFLPSSATSLSIANATRGVLSVPSFAAGDVLRVTTDAGTAGQVAWAVLSEII